MKARTKDGAEIFYELYDFTDPWKPAEAIVLHHGGRGNHTQWYRWIALLSRHHRTIAIDARGRGGSTIPPEDHQWSVDQFASDVVAVLDDAAIDKVHFVGNSFGTIVGENFAANYPDRIGTLSLVAPMYRMTAMKADTSAWVQEIERVGSLEFHRSEVRKMLPEGAEPGLIEWQAQQLAAVAVPVVRSFLAFTATIDQAELLPRIEAPTLLMVPMKSDRIPPTESEFIRAHIPNTKVVTFPDAPHDLASARPERLTELITDFIRENG